MCIIIFTFHWEILYRCPADRGPKKSCLYMYVCMYVCVHILLFHIVRKKKWPFGLSLLVGKSLYVCVCTFYFLFSCSVNRQNTYKSTDKKNFGLQRKTLRQRRIETEAPPYEKYSVHSTLVGISCFLRKCNIRRYDIQLF